MAALTILTVNDVYDVAPDAHGMGGMAELATLLQRERAATPATSTLLTTINGDFLSASRTGAYYKGAHMIDLLNHMDVDFAVFVVVRGQESSFGNLVADAIRSELGANVGHVSGGFLRSNALHPAKATLTARMIHCDMPIQGPAVLTRIRASDLQEALVQQLGAYPALSGSFPHVSGVRLVYDSRSRTMTSFTDEAGNEIDANAELTVATTQFIAGGGDGCVAWRKGSVVETHDIMANEVIRFVEKQRILAYAATEGRIRILDAS
ncbi:hypothetical protein SDRG_16057 [Saprolegnia diclina VS20]|uniref:5'-Nucleotidase C-terminal domain-containing protein n=1 Tax=Saprolegnia diclina (strain VS20) TaxID=1156394 RepID=T0R9C4_SAPDV|nr:hypothetical protein SDRG_16057 [Saprolegnia diclina VS20]EQC26107.1 hypothetical protein SDRG_16057 [Saprolegnia diclina VS20]|eukprot:XP_008620474.1 hypothetical protein SDRG_16057 [Saprolegnia diclina VS20]